MAHPDDIARARTLRRESSHPERRLWHCLRTLRAHGHHFRRQAPFRGYCLDFVSHADRPVIEVDGAQHGSPESNAHDAIRDNVLAREGVVTTRFLVT